MNTPLKVNADAAVPVTDPIRVMVVDDSVVVRGLVSRWVDSDPELAVVATHRNGKLAVDDILRSDPDVVILDIEMPVMDGLAALPLMLEHKPDLVVVMASTLTRRNAKISLQALSAGAADYVPKPESNSGVTTSTDFRRELIEKVRHLGDRARHRKKRGLTPIARVANHRPAKLRDKADAPAKPVAGSGHGDIKLRPFSAIAPRVLTIGSSTGGPQALAALFTEIGPAIDQVPVFVIQHMPASFTAILAEHISRTSGRPAAEGQDGEVIGPGRIYVAPGGRHMTLKKSGVGHVIRLNDDPPINFCKPAVDPMFEAVAEIYGSAALALVLTGMGHDGAGGTRRIAHAGGSVIAQDEASSVVWGMPGAAAQTGLCSAVLPLTDIGPKIVRLLKGRR